MGRLDQLKSNRSDGSYSCFLGEDKNETVQKALGFAAEWNKTNYREKYEVLVGQVTEKAEQPIQFNLVKIQ